MDRKNIAERIRDVLLDTCAVVDPVDLKGEARLIDDLGLDSLDIVEFVIAIEDEFGFEETLDTDVVGMVTFDDVVNHVERKLRSWK